MTLLLVLERKIGSAFVRDYQRRQVKQALRNIYPTFAQKYPQWSVSLFDTHFLAHRAAPLIEHCLHRNRRPTLDLLTTAWATQLWCLEATRQRRVAELNPVAHDFLHMLATELHRDGMCSLDLHRGLR